MEGAHTGCDDRRVSYERLHDILTAALDRAADAGLPADPTSLSFDLGAEDVTVKATAEGADPFEHKVSVTDLADALDEDVAEPEAPAEEGKAS